MMLIGSRALAAQDKSFKAKPSSDWDIISKGAWPILDDRNKIEWHDASEYLSGEAEARFMRSEQVYISSLDHCVPMCSLRGLAAIKRSHLSLDWNWDRHMTQYVRHLKKHLNPEDMPWIKAREKITLELARQRSPSLMQTKDQFFDDYVEKKFDHDYLHELLAFYDKPLYTQIHKDGQEVLCDENKWLALKHEDRIKCIQEEVYVIAAERFLIPRDFKYGYRRAYFNAVKKVCTTLTSGWFRDYAIDNWEEICNNYSSEKFEKLKKELKYDYD